MKAVEHGGPAVYRTDIRRITCLPNVLAAGAEPLHGGVLPPVEARAAYRRDKTALCAALLILLAAGMLAGQELTQVAAPRSTQRKPPPAGPILQPSEEAESLMARARESVQRQDWKLAIDSLQRIVDLPGEHVLKAGETKYEAARIQAHRQIAALPEAGLEAYRTLNDPEAAALLENGLREHDHRLLQTIVRRFLLTRSGDDAAVILAEWLMDEGRYSEAASLLRTVRLTYPDSDLPSWVVPLRLAACFAAMGQRQRAEDLLLQAASSQSGGPPPGTIEAVRQVAGRQQADKPSESASWPMACGNVARTGRQHDVTPSLVEQHCLAAALPIPEPREGFVAAEQLAAQRRLTPGRQPVFDRELLIVKAARGLIAFDADSLLEMWRADPPPAPIDSPGTNLPGGRMVGYPVRPADLRTVSATLLLAGPANGDLVIVDDKVLTIVHSESSFVQPLQSLDGARGVGLVPFASANRLQSNTIAAYAIEDGSLVWQSDLAGLTGSASVPVEESATQFLAVPIPVNRELLTPCLVNSDLHLAALDPATGKRSWHVYLCGVDSGRLLSPLTSLRLAVADDMAFVCTEQGLIVAVDLASRSVVWATRYSATEASDSPVAWAAETPAAVADVLIAAPMGAGLLLCIDRASGDIRWQAPRGRSVQILGCTATCAWILGKDLEMIDLATGKPVWTTACEPPTGRGVIAGDRIYVPTAEGLAAFQTNSGEPLALPKTDGARVGSLFAWDGALYSIGLHDIYRYPDLVNGYAAAVARHEAAPADAARAIRLARLELLRNQPATALGVMERLPQDLKDRDPRRHRQVTRLRVQSLLAIAADERNPADACLEALEKARMTAESTEDRIETALALGDFHKRRNRPADACGQYLSLVLSPDGDETVSIEQGLRQQARLLADQRLSKTLERVPADQRDSLLDRVQQVLTDAVTRHDQRAMRRLADCVTLGEISVQAKLLLAGWAMEKLEFEQAESLLRQVLTLADSAALQAEAAARLTSICLLPAELRQPQTAESLLDRLESEWGDIEVPALVVTDLLGESPFQPLAGKMSCRKAAGILRRRLGAGMLSSRDATPLPSPGIPRKATTVPGENTWPLVIRNDAGEPSRTVLVGLSENKKLHARRIEDQAAVWQTEMRLSDQPAVEIGGGAAAGGLITYTLMDTPFNTWTGPPASGVADGQVLIVNSAFGLHAIGLLTGRRLWSRPYEPPELTSDVPVCSDQWIWVQGDRLLSIDASGRLEAALPWDGGKILWSRTMPQRRWRTVRARGKYVIAADGDLHMVDVLRLDDGRHVGQCGFNQPKNAVDRINLLLFDEVICGPVSETEVAAFDLATPGTERWRVSVTGRLSQIFKPAPDLAAVADRTANVDILDPATGKSRRRLAFSSCAEGVTDGALVDGTLYVTGYRSRPSPDVRRVGSWSHGLAAARFDDGTILWQRDDLGPGTFLTAELLRASSNVIPLAASWPALRVRDATATQPTVDDQKARIEMLLVNKADGKQVGDRQVALLPEGTRTAAVLDVIVRPNRVLVRTAPGEVVFELGTAGGRSAAEGTVR